MVGKTSPWLQVDSQCLHIRKNSEMVITYVISILMFHTDCVSCRLTQHLLPRFAFHMS